MAKLTVVTLNEELKKRGFSAWTDDERVRYINWGYQRVAMFSRADWEETSTDTSVAVGAFSVDITTMIPNLRDVIAVVITTTDKQARLKPMSEDDFFRLWLPYDLTLSDRRGEPEYYYVWDDKLYILPPPSGARAIRVTYHQKVVEVSLGAPTFITPQYLDEAITLATLVICHMRKLEWESAKIARAQLQEFFGIALAEDAANMQEQQERVIPNWAVER